MFKENIPLAGHTGYKIGGPARYFFEARNLDELESAVREARKKNLSIFVLGGGTNLLVSDEGFDGLALKPDFHFLEQDGNEVNVGAGIPIAELLNYLITHSLTGLEWAGGLPGTVGGAVRGNAGAFGGETKDLIKSVRSFDIEKLKEVEREAPACDFGYRSSVFKKKGGTEIIMSAVFALKKGDTETVRKSIHEKINYRRERHPLEYPNIGSIFKNVPLTRISADSISLNLPGSTRKSAAIPVKTDPVPVVPAAYLISEAGLKGVSFGGAMVSPKHPNFIVNVLEAKASDVKTLIELVKNEVHGKFGIILEEEVQRI
ncbi:MAG: UDP-N-acetylmuramate dehydrogenase [Candidatus Liptonbacteria bacterium]|nr:UDP-N-acetylmuramate dehydrogenase [Candidatus Liptonbacteria bacterium]